MCAFLDYLCKYGMNRAGVGNTYTTICGKLFAGFTSTPLDTTRVSMQNTQFCCAAFVVLLVLSSSNNQPPLLFRTIFRVIELQQPRVHLVWGELWLAYFFLLRRSEYLFIARKHRQYVLRLKGLVFQSCATGGVLRSGGTSM
jgi:hypothetical protein